MLMKLLLKNNSTRPRDSCAGNMRPVRCVQQMQAIGRTIGQPMWHKSGVGQLSFLSSRTKWQRLPAGDTVCGVLAAGNRCHFVLLDKDESCPTADLCHIGFLMVRPIRPVSCQTRPRCDKHTHDPASGLHSLSACTVSVSSEGWQVRRSL